MRGQTIIELTDKSGNKETYIDNNMLTNALQYYFANAGFMNKLNVNKNNMVEELLGGIMLFDTAITEDAEIVYVPSGINMIGNGAVGTVSNDSVLELGSYNSSESGWQADGSYVEVYDFSSSQANGTIACCCLTSKNHGYIGEGNSLSNIAKDDKKSMSELSGDKEVITGISNYVVRVSYTDSTVTVIDTNNLYYSSGTVDEHFSTTGKLKLLTYRIPLQQINLRGTMSAPVLINTEEIELPEEFVSIVGTSNKWEITYDSDCNAYVIFMPFSSSLPFDASNGLCILKIGTDNTLTIYDVKNTTGKMFNYIYNPCIEKDNIIFAESKAPEVLYKIDINTMAAHEIPLPTKYWDYGSRWKRYEGIISEGVYKIDVVAGKVYSNNGTNYKNGYYTYTENYRVIGNPLFCWSVGIIPNSKSGLYIWRHADYIASINNLETPIVKTPEKTMKVTYRITF